MTDCPSQIRRGGGGLPALPPLTTDSQEGVGQSAPILQGTRDKTQALSLLDKHITNCTVFSGFILPLNFLNSYL